MADLNDDVSRALGVPVVDGVAAAVKLVEPFAGLGLLTAKRGEYARPLPKRYEGALAAFAPPATALAAGDRDEIATRSR